MDCPHPDIDCEDCAEQGCVLRAPCPLPAPQKNCDACPFYRILCEFICRLEEERALLTADMPSWDARALQERRVP